MTDGPHLIARDDELSPDELAVRQLIKLAGDDPAREGVLKTPSRVVKAFGEMFKGYRESAEDILTKTAFRMDDGDEDVAPYNGVVVLRDVELYSTCEHHMLPFVGRAHVAYIPSDGGRVVGLSKLARLVDCFARRLQCQERITTQVVDALVTYLEPKGAACVIEASHFCMRARGVNKQNSIMVTSEVRGVFREDATARAEVMKLMRGT